MGLWLKGIFRDPGHFLLKSGQRLLQYLSPFTDAMRDQAKLYKLITWIIVFPMSFVGISVSIRRNWRGSGLLILFIFYYVLLHSLSYVDDGLVYRYPIQPFLCIFAAYGYWFFYQKSTKRHI